MLRKNLLFVLLIICSLSGYADQLATLSKAQANKTVKYLKENEVSEAILWCSCCTDDPMIKINVIKYFSRYTGIANQYEVIIQGKSEDGRLYNEPVDLAYVFLRSGTEAKSLGKLLGFKCDPCTLPFNWSDYLKSGKQASIPDTVIDANSNGLSYLESQLVGTWKDDNSTFIFSADRSLTMKWDNGNTSTGVWSAVKTILNLHFTRGSYRSNDYYAILEFTGKILKYRILDNTKKQVVYTAIKISE